MFGWLFPKKPVPRVTIIITQGTRGAFRWKAVDKHGTTVAICPVQGFKARPNAIAAAELCFNSEIAAIRDEKEGIQ